MISIYVSHKFIEEFQIRDDLTNDVIFDFQKHFLKKIRGINVIVETDYNSIENLINEDEFYNDLSEISGISCDKTWLDKLEDESFLYRGDLSKVFLLGNDVDCDELVSRFNLLFINNINLETLWSQVRTDRDISEMIPSNVNENEFSFNNWSKLSNFKHPFHSLLISDLYILGDKSNQKIEDNLKPMLQNFSEFNCNREYELVIISKEMLKPRNILNPVEKIEEVYQLINKDKCKLIYYDETKKASLKEHDRQILTNYMIFDCGAGWNIFKQNNEIHTSTKIIQNYYVAIKDIKFKIPISGKFDQNNNLLFDEKDYHFPLNFNPSIFE